MQNYKKIYAFTNAHKVTDTPMSFMLSDSEVPEEKILFNKKDNFKRTPSLCFLGPGNLHNCLFPVTKQMLTTCAFATLQSLLQWHCAMP